jgi:hypothetical protein
MSVKYEVYKCRSISKTNKGESWSFCAEAGEQKSSSHAAVLQQGDCLDDLARIISDHYFSLDKKDIDIDIVSLPPRIQVVNPRPIGSTVITQFGEFSEQEAIRLSVLVAQYTKELYE